MPSFRELPLPLHCPSTAFHCLSVTFPWPSIALPSPFHCPSTAFPYPSTAPSPACPRPSTAPPPPLQSLRRWPFPPTDNDTVKKLMETDAVSGVFFLFTNVLALAFNLCAGERPQLAAPLSVLPRRPSHVFRADSGLVDSSIGRTRRSTKYSRESRAMSASAHN